MKKKAKKDYGRWLWVLPAIVLVICLFVYPLGSQIFYSFTNKTLIKTTYGMKGLSNYTAILTDKNFWLALWTSVKWTVLSLLFQILTGFTAALALNSIKNSMAKADIQNTIDYSLGISHYCHCNYLEMAFKWNLWFYSNHFGQYRAGR